MDPLRRKPIRTVQALQDDPSVRSVRRGVAWTSVTFFLLGTLFLLYQGTEFRASFLQHYRLYQSHVRFNEKLGDEEFPWLSQVREQSRQLIAEGLYLPAFRHWVESRTLFRTITFQSWLVTAGFFVVLLFFMYLVYQYFVNALWFSRSIEIRKKERLEQMHMAAKILQKEQQKAVAAAAAAAADKPQEKAEEDDNE